MPRIWAISQVELILILAAGLVWMLPSAGMIVFFSFTPALLMEGGLAVAQAGLAVSLASWISIVSMPTGGWLADRIGRINLLIVAGCAGCALAAFLLPVGGAVLVWVILFGVALGVWPGAIMALPGQVLSPNGRSTGFGLFYSVFYMGMAIFPPIAGWLQDATGTAQASVNFGGLLFVLTVVALAGFRLLQKRWVPGEELATGAAA